MNKFKGLLSNLLLQLAAQLTRLANKLVVPEFNIFDLTQMSDGSFDTFKEGMVSKDYRVRHQAATKLVSWYLLGNGQPTVDELQLAARILLEEFDVNDGDISRLVNCWIAQASAATEDIRLKEELNEQVIYDYLQLRKSQIIDNTTK
jgi:hypothetical protein